MIRRLHRVIPVVLSLLLVTLSVPVALAQNFGQDKVAGRIADAYEVSVDSVKAMHASGLGWGEIIMILELSRLSGRSVTEIQDMHAGGMGFGRIARELNLDPQDLGQAVANVMSEGKSGGQASGTAGAVGREHSNGKGKP